MKNNINNILIRPRITEKATMKNESGFYVFEIMKNATKSDVKEAVKSIYNVVPVRIRTVNTPSKRVIVRGKRGVSSGHKKAYVYLKKGDTIEIV